MWEYDDPRWPAIPAQDFSNLPRQQKGLHSQGFEYMRLSEKAEGHLSNLERVIDGFLAGRGYDELLPALQQINVNPLTRPIVDVGFLTGSCASPMSSKASIDDRRFVPAVDDGVVATFTAGGVSEQPGTGKASGTEELLAAYTSWVPCRPHRHLARNTGVVMYGVVRAEPDVAVVRYEHHR